LYWGIIAKIADALLARLKQAVGPGRAKAITSTGISELDEILSQHAR
jgi:hypothetical protein